jgi:uncharacterized OsmC-like protein
MSAEGEAMIDMEHIKIAFERNVQTLTLRPSIGQKRYVTKVRVRNGLTCDIEDGPWRLTADLAKKGGGNEAGPTPGTFGRAALGSCLAMSYVMWAAKLEIALTWIEVEVQADADARGLYGVDDVTAGYTEVRYIISLASPAPHADIIRLLDTAEAHSPYMDVFRRQQALRRIVHISRGEE